MNTSDYFDNYRDILAKFDSTGSCGHAIAKGDAIGYNPRNRKTSCATCWHRWQYDVAAESSMEQFGTDCAYDC